MRPRLPSPHDHPAPRVPGRGRSRLLAVLLVPVTALAVVAGSPAARAQGDPVGVWPLTPEPRVVTAFDPPADPWGAGHRGVDLSGAVGRPVRTALAGRVTYVGRIAGRGIVTVAHHGAAAGTRTTYEPVAGIVTVGDVVGAGDVIGRLEALGGHCLPAACLHWGWLRGETYLDPLRLVGGGPIRLLPLWRDAPVAARLPIRAWVPPLEAWRPPLDVLP